MLKKSEMLKRVNILSLIQAHDSLKQEAFKDLLNYYGIEIKNAEIEDLRDITMLLNAQRYSMAIFDKFYVGYKIPQIGKEFDLLRFGTEFIINIELKKSCTEEKIKKQLLRNKYYLSFIGRKIYAFTFVSESRELYCLTDEETLLTSKTEQLEILLNSQQIDDDEIADNLFSPSDYLVSPFNSTENFLNSRYFLTHQQEDVKNKIFGTLKLPKSANFISITGSAGTGKTLLTYDIAKELICSGRKPLIIHCGQLNDGHQELKKHNWEITSIKNYRSYNIGNYDVVIIDEAQRINPNQLDTIIEMVQLTEGCCIFSHDKLQTLAQWEEQRDISTIIESIKSITQYRLSEKIRTNKEIAAFIKMLFNNKKTLPIPSSGNIEINYFNSAKDARNYLDQLDCCKWEVLRFTPSLYNKEHHEAYSGATKKTSHEVIGQEFDGVAVTIDNFFSYNEDGNLIYKGKAYYHPAKMLFQNITRSRNRLKIIIINNEELLNRCITILQQP